MERAISVARTKNVNVLSRIDVRVGVDFSNDKITTAEMKEDANEAIVTKGVKDLRYPNTKAEVKPRWPVAVSISTGRRIDRNSNNSPTRTNVTLRNCTGLEGSGLRSFQFRS
jgi:hypothetical protein